MMQASPIVCHSVLMSIVFHHYKQLMKLTDKKNKDELDVKSPPEVHRICTLDRYCPELSK